MRKGALVKRLVHALVLLVACALPAVAAAQNPDPRDYEVGYFVPNRTTIINTYLRHQSASKGRDFSALGAAFRATYILKLGDLVITPFDAILPVSDQTAYTRLNTVSPAFAMVPNDLKLSLHATGMGDLIYLPTIGHGVTQNAKDHTHTWYALTTYITAPTGKYDPNKLLNVGGNRWVFNPLLMVGQRFLRAFTLEAMANLSIYGKNDEYRVPNPALAGRNLELTQKPSFGAMAHLAVDLHPSFFVATSYQLAVNGERELELPAALGGTTQRETKGNTVHSVRLNFGMRVTPQTLVLFQWNQDVAGSEGATVGRFFGLRISHAFFKAPVTPSTRMPISDPAATPAAR
jgi:hypothetical protein